MGGLQGNIMEIKEHPGNIREFQRNKPLRSYLGDEFYHAYLKIKNIEWNDYSRSLTQWEKDFTLDC